LRDGTDGACGIKLDLKARSEYAVGNRGAVNLVDLVGPDLTIVSAYCIKQYVAVAGLAQ
jgi:hypothetical protein